MSHMILLKNLRSSFESLRTNGGASEIIGNFPFMLSLVEAFIGFFSRIYCGNNKATVDVGYVSRRGRPSCWERSRSRRLRHCCASRCQDPREQKRQDVC